VTPTKTPVSACAENAEIKDKKQEIIGFIIKFK
jgi:hypothetical protein